VTVLQDFMESACAEWADGVLEAEPAMAEWMRGRGWRPTPLALDEHWIAAITAATGQPLPCALSGSAGTPLVTVCLTHHERPHYLRQAVASLQAQTYSPLEVVLMDDGSRGAESRSCLEAFEEDFARRGWRILRQDNAYLGAARNRAARAARGDYLLFMDDDNVAYPHEVATFVRAVRRSGADALTCFHDAFHGAVPPASPEQIAYRFVCAGGPLACGVFANCFGDANALVRREAFERVGGFAEERDFGAQDHEWFARLVLAGLRLDLAPYRAAAPAWTAPLLDLAPGWRRQLIERFELLRRTGAAEAECARLRRRLAAWESSRIGRLTGRLLEWLSRAPRP
jgi:cellulose synthase/poly-beta-1,6-N-acetylglucosamine synthase-like glycosyltransferase